MPSESLYKNRGFLLLLIGQTVSGLGTWISFVGLNLYVYEVFGSGKILGTFMVVRMLPAVFFGPIGGWLADRYPRRRILLACDALRAVLILGFLFTRSLPAFFLLGLLLSGIDKVFLAAYGAFLPSLVSKEQLLPANAATRMGRSLITIIGPAAGGLLVAFTSYKWVFIIDSCTFAASVLCLLLIAAAEPAPSAKPGGAPFREFGIVFSFFRAHLALAFLAGVRLVDAFGSGAYNTALPIFSRTLSQASAYGWLIGAWALGEFCGALLIGRVPKALSSRREALFSVSVVLMACGMGLMFRCGLLYPALAAVFLGGVGDGVSTVLFNTVLMKESPEESRGRIFGTTIAMIYTVVAVGMGAAGLLLDRMPLRLITDAASVFIVLSVLIGYILFYLARASRASRTAAV